MSRLASLFSILAAIAGGCDDGPGLADPSPIATGPALFFSDWRTGRGVSEAALRDGGKWTGYDQGGGSSGVEVVAAGGMGFPSGMANVLRSAQGGGSTYNNVVGMGILPAPQAGEHRYYRWYQRFDELVSSGFDHGVELSIGTGAYAFSQLASPRTGGVRLAFQISNEDAGGAGPNVYYDLGGNFYGGTGSAKYLQRQRVYRIEFHVHFPTISTVQMREIRVYDDTGALVYGNADFEVGDPMYANGKTLATHQPISSLPGDGRTLWRNFHFGSNGQSGWPSMAGYRYYGGFRVSSAGWNGPWTADGG